MGVWGRRQAGDAGALNLFFFWLHNQGEGWKRFQKGHEVGRDFRTPFTTGNLPAFFNFCPSPLYTYSSPMRAHWARPGLVWEGGDLVEQGEYLQPYQTNMDFIFLLKEGSQYTKDRTMSFRVLQTEFESWFCWLSINWSKSFFEY